MDRKASLRERILLADSEEAITGLLKEGEGYLKATNHTRSGWRRAAKIRNKQLLTERKDNEGVTTPESDSAPSAQAA